MNTDKRMEQALQWVILHCDEQNEAAGQRLTWRRRWQHFAFRHWCRSEENAAAYLDAAMVHACLQRWKHAQRRHEEGPSNVVPLFEEQRAQGSKPLPQTPIQSVEPAPAPTLISRRKLAAALTGIAAGGGIVTAALKKVMGSGGHDLIASGHVLEVVLRDGVMQVARNSDFRLHPSSQAHTVHLLNGQAAFNLSQSGPRITRVTAPLGEVLAGAAEYAVIGLDALLVVTVLKGTVRVISSLLSAAEVEVRAGQRLTLRRGSAPAIVRVDARRELAWVHGDLSFDGESFAEAVATLNRFNEMQIVPSPDVARLTVTTQQCALSDPERFVRRFARGEDLEVHTDGKLIRVFERGAGPSL